MNTHNQEARSFARRATLVLAARDAKVREGAVAVRSSTITAHGPKRRARSLLRNQMRLV
jgi:hypothetical protein